MDIVLADVDLVGRGISVNKVLFTILVTYSTRYGITYNTTISQLICCLILRKLEELEMYKLDCWKKDLMSNTFDSLKLWEIDMLKNHKLKNKPTFCNAYLKKKK